MNEQLKKQVIATEQTFAETMAKRDFEGFVSFLADEAVFFSSDKALRGKNAVAEAWKSYFEAPEAPFSWKPERVEVLDSGTLALSTGPVHDSKGKRIGTFTSIWRLEENNHWRIIFDIGNQVCE
jgi:ketosteroid isomerase-like protein